MPVPPPVRPRALLAVATGGVAGALARYGLARAWPTDPGDFPWTTLAVNATGCLLIGVLMVVLTERAGRRPAHPLWRPALGTGVLGGYTTFSAYAVELDRLLEGGHAGAGLAYGAATPVLAVAAAAAGVALTRRARGLGA